MFYGQFLEDKYINELFPNENNGVCIEIGAYDGVSFSNSYFFEKKGWNCLCIEPIPDSFDKCKSVRKNCVKCCISDKDKDDAEFTVFNILGNNLSAISSLNPDERLVESHKHLIKDTSKIQVKVRSLTSLLDELNFDKDIDFISIDTENTELDVLKGIDFNKYNIKMLIIENNYNEPFCENYLKDRYVKINRIAINDFYIKQSISPNFRIISSYYYITNYWESANVTNKVHSLYSLFKFNTSNDTFTVSNNIFGDTLLNNVKTLYINILNSYGQNKTLKFTEGAVVNWNEIDIMFEQNNTSDLTMINVSIGEIIDKYSILELKQKYITNFDSLNEIQKELTTFKKYTHFKESFAFFYKLLLHINEEIWIDTDKIKQMNIDDQSHENILQFAKLSNNIFVNNQKRFRLKNYFNQLVATETNIKEQKSYNKTCCYIDITDEEVIYDKIPEINYLFLEYDQLYFDTKYTTIITNIFQNPNKGFIDNDNDNAIGISIKETIDITKKTEKNEGIHVKLTEFIMDDRVRHNYVFDPIKYVSGGLIGDFIYQLSVINEKFYLTGRKGLVYLDNIGERFVFGLQKAYDDLYNTVIKQRYIQDFHLYNNEIIDVNLVCWRHTIEYMLQNNFSFYEVYKINYNIEWGKHPWIKCDKDEAWSNKIVINTTHKRFISSKQIIAFIELIKDKIDECIFVSFEIKEWEYFCNKTGLNIPLHLIYNFDELSVIINSCKYAYLSLSSPQAFANAVYKDHTCLNLNESNGIVLPKYDFILSNMTHKFSHLKMLSS